MRSRAVVWAALVAFVLAPVGCSLTEQGLRKNALLPEKIGGGTGSTFAPKRCVLQVMIVQRPQGDPALGEAIWRVADEQAVDPEARRVLQANGLRFGRAEGDLPAEVREILSAPAPKQPQALTIAVPEADHTLIDPATPPNPNLSLILGQKDKAVGKVYQDARGFLRVSATFEGDDAIRLRIIPEVHHGPIQQGWGIAPGATPMTPGQLISKSGQKEETFRELAGTLVLKQGQVAVLGGRHDKRGSLGNFLFGAEEPGSDRPTEKVIFVWASRSEGGRSDAVIPPPSLVPFDPATEIKDSKPEER